VPLLAGAGARYPSLLSCVHTGYTRRGQRGVAGSLTCIDTFTDFFGENWWMDRRGHKGLHRGSLDTGPVYSKCLRRGVNLQFIVRNGQNRTFARRRGAVCSVGQLSLSPFCSCNFGAWLRPKEKRRNPRRLRRSIA
jgi:hypothetical protein